MKNRKLILHQVREGRPDLAVTNLVISNRKIMSVKLMIKWIRWIDHRENPYAAIRSIYQNPYYWEV